MKSIINEVLFENEQNCEKETLNSEYNIINKELTKLICKFEKGLTESQKDDFQEIFHKQQYLEVETAEIYFKKGFKTGVLLGLEIVEE